jgi:uncharacterized repeat protein (TIGR01451 family)
MIRSGICLCFALLLAVGVPAWGAAPVASAQTAEEEPAEPLAGDFIPGQLIIRFKPGVTPEEISDFYAEHGLAEKENLDLDPADNNEEMRLASIQLSISAQLVTTLEDDPRVEYVEPNYLLHLDKVPNDPDYSKLWNLNNSGQTGGTTDADVDAPETWDVTTGSNQVIIGVIDTGIDWKHEDLVANLWVNPGECPGGKCEANSKDDDGNGYVDDFHGVNTINDTGDPMDDYGHGTHVAGTIGAVGNNGIGVVGVSWNVRIAACKFLSASGSGSVASAIKCFQYFHQLKNKYKQNIVATNNSWGGAISSDALRDAMAGPDQPLHICAAGNSDSGQPHFPAAYELPNILSVAATDHNDQYASFSNYGPDWVDMAAPGVDVLSTVPKGSCGICNPTGYDTASGTSMATPHVAGAVALIYGLYSKLTPEQVKGRLLAALDPLSDRTKETATNGRLNLLNALENDPTPPAAPNNLAAAGVLLTKVNLTWTATGDDGTKGQANAYDLRYSTSPISSANWEQATPAQGEPSPQAPGTVEQFTVEGLEPGITYYFALRVLDNAGNLSEMSNVVIAKTSTGSIVFADDMESGPDKWTVAGNNSLWHLSQLRANSPTTAWYYGKEDTRTYDTGGANNGTITTQAIDVTGTDDALLTFYEWSQVQSSARLDRTQVQISTDGQGWTTVFESHGTDGAWVKQEVSLSDYLTATSTLYLRFWFDTVDETANNFEGWYVDDVEIRTAKLEAPGQTRPLANLIMYERNLLFDPTSARSRPAAGEEVTLHATVLNHGTADANEVVVQFMEVISASLTPVGQPQTIANIPVGGSGTAEVTYRTPSSAGNRTVQVNVDPNNFVPEANETDNVTHRDLAVASAAAANLVVKAANIGFEPPAPDPGDQVTIRATVFNTGTVEARNVSVQFNDASGTTILPIAEPQTIDVIPPGGSSVVETTFDTAGVAVGPTGARDIEVVVDLTNAVPEISESDNRAEKQLRLTPSLAPNLNMQAVNIGFDPATPTAGEVITIYATILNDGSAVAENVAVQFMETVGSTGAPIGPQQIIEQIPAGGSATAAIAFDTANRAGDRKIDVVVDPNNFIAEVRETDNRAQKTLKVMAEAAPNLVALANNVNTSPIAPTEGETVTLYATILNNGVVDAVNVTVQFIDATGGAALPIGEVQTIPFIPAGGSGVAQTMLETAGKAGDRALQVVVDPGNQIQETDESDNTARDGLRIAEPPAPNLVLLASNIQFHPPQPNDSSQVTIRAVVLNNGPVEARNVLVQFIDLTTGTPTPIAEEQYIDVIPPGGSGSAQATLDLAGLRSLPMRDRRIQVLVDSNNLITEGNEGDNTALKLLPISTSPAPNLVMLASNIGFNPPRPTAGQPVTVTAIVLNKGNAPAANVVVQVVDISTGRPLPVGEEQTIDLIPVGGSGIVQVVFETTGKMGDFQIRVVVDPNNLVAESDETDNRNTATLSVVQPPTANLTVQPSNLGFSPPSPQEGEPVTVTATILNNGPVTATDVLVQFVDVTDGGFEPIGEKQTLPAIPAGSSATVQVRYETTGRTGERKIQVLVDPHTTIPEANEADNNATQTLIIAPPPAPNLTILEGNIGFNPKPEGMRPGAGEVVSVTATILNNGELPAQDVTVQFLDTSVNGNNVPIGPGQTIDVIPPGGSATVSVNYDTTDKAGDRRIQVVVDSGNLIPESNETDNTARKTLKVAPPAAPNLLIQATNIGFDPPTPNPGDQVTVYATVINDGNSTAEGVVVQFVDMTVSGISTPIGQPQTIERIPAGGSGLAQITYDTTGLTGDRKIQVVVDPNNFIREIRETDNTIQKTLSLVAGSAPNLAVLITNIGFEPAQPEEGEPITLIATIFNDGNSPANNVLVQFVDATETATVPIGQPQTIDTIPVGGSATAQVVYETAGRAGVRKITVLVDPNNFITEPKETDNTASRSLVLSRPPQPNLVALAENVGFNPATPIEGSPLIVHAVILNEGTDSASDVVVQLMETTGGTATPVGAPQVIGVIPAGSSGAAQMLFATVGKVGDRQLEVVVDPNNFIPEHSEDDNRAVKSLAVAPAPAPNLKVLPGNFKFNPPAPEQGDVVTVTVTLLNDGNADATDVVVQFSEIITGGVLPIGLEQTIDMLPAGSSTTLQAIYTNTDLPGEREIEIVVDPGNIVTESDESDNRATQPLLVTPPIIPNLVVTPRDLLFAPTTPIAGDIVTVTVTIHNQGTGDVAGTVAQVLDVTEGEPELIGDPFPIESLPAGASTTFTVTYDTIDLLGERRIQVVVDPEDLIDETDEEDNVAAKTLRVLSEAERPEPQANLAITETAILFNPVTPTVGSPVTVTVVVTNNGAAAATDVMVEVVDITGDATEVVGRQMITGTVAAGRAGRARFFYDTADKLGVRSLQVTVDPDNAVNESNEEDNQATRTLTVTEESGETAPGAPPTAPAPPTMPVTQSLPSTVTAVFDQPNLTLSEEVAIFRPDYVAVAGEGSSLMAIAATVQNNGPIDAGNVAVQFVAMTNSGWTVIGEQAVGLVAAGASSRAEIALPEAELADYREIRVLVDPQNAIFEADETDNRVSTVVQLQAGEASSP